MYCRYLKTSLDEERTIICVPYDLKDSILTNNNQNEELIFKGIARRRGLLLPGNELDVNKAELLLLKEFKEGLIVKLVLDQLC